MEDFKMSDTKEVVNTNNVNNLIAVLAMVFALFFLSQAIKTPFEAIFITAFFAVWMIIDGYKKESLVTTIFVILGITIILLTPYFGVPMYYYILGALVALFGFLRPDINLKKINNYKEA